MREVPSKFRYGMLEAETASQRSKDPSTQVGAAIFNRDGRIVAKGYNGMPQGLEENPELWSREHKYDWVIHAELNAIANAARTGVSTRGAQMFITIPPCLDCAKAIVAAGIEEVFFCSLTYADWIARGPHWEESVNKALGFLETCNVKVFPL